MMVASSVKTSKIELTNNSKSFFSTASSYEGTGEDIS